MLVGAQNWQEINYEKVKKCLTVSKVAPVKLILGLYPHTFPVPLNPEPVHLCVSFTSLCCGSGTFNAIYIQGISHLCKASTGCDGGCKKRFHTFVSTRSGEQNNLMLSSESINLMKFSTLSLSFCPHKRTGNANLITGSTYFMFPMLSATDCGLLQWVGDGLVAIGFGHVFTSGWSKSSTRIRKTVDGWRKQLNRNNWATPPTEEVHEMWLKASETPRKWTRKTFYYTAQFKLF